MQLSPPPNLKEIAGIINADFEGNPDHIISGLNEIHKVVHGDLVFVDKEKYYEQAVDSAATAVLINVKRESHWWKKRMMLNDGKTDVKKKAFIFSDDPFRDFNKLITHFSRFEPSATAISKTASIGEGTVIQPNAFIGNHVSIGKNCLIHSNVSIYDRTVIGNQVVIHSNTVVGSDAFYFKKRPGGHDKLYSCGRVVIEDDVEIGACCAVDRGVTGDTRIGKGTKIDNLVQIGHDTVVGRNCLFAAQVGISGAVIIEDDVTLWGQVGVISGITIKKGAVALAQSGVANSLEGNKVYFGSPAIESREKFRQLVLLRKLPEIAKHL